MAAQGPSSPEWPGPGCPQRSQPLQHPHTGLGTTPRAVPTRSGFTEAWCHWTCREAAAVAGERVDGERGSGETRRGRHAVSATGRGTAPRRTGGGGAAGLSGGHSLQPRSHPLVTQANGGEEQHVPTHATPPRATGTLPRARRSHWTRRHTLPLTGNGHIAQSHSQNDGTARVLFLRQSVRIDLIPCLLEF